MYFRDRRLVQDVPQAGLQRRSSSRGHTGGIPPSVFSHLPAPSSFSPSTRFPAIPATWAAPGKGRQLPGVSTEAGGAWSWC